MEGGLHTNERLRVLVVLEQTLGHVTHGENLTKLLPKVAGVDPTFIRIPFMVSGWRARVPMFGNWTIRAGWRTRRALRRHGRGRHHDALIVHSQVPAVLLGRIPKAPLIVSLDATPKQYDRLGEHYAHGIGSVPVERVKSWLNRRCFRRAAHLVTWAEWTKQSLVDEYGVPSEKITVVPPGVDVERWHPSVPDRCHDGDDVVRILFVGGDLRRKGGHHLIESFADLRRRHGTSVELHLVTTSPVEPGEGMTVYDSLTANSPDLIELYRRCDIFCLPTLGDCLPMVLAEAGASGLALVATDVGAISDIVRDGDTGLLVPIDDVRALTCALDSLVADRSLRRQLATRARTLVVAEHDAASNAARLVDVARQVAIREGDAGCD